MRPIKFQAWHKKRKKMYSLVEFRCDEQGVHVSLVSNSYDGPWFEVSTDDVDLRQFTGLKDLQGNEGNAGDLVLMFGRSIFSIVWDDYYARFQLELAKGDELNKVYDMGMLQYGVIVGNIYENPDILEESEA